MLVELPELRQDGQDDIRHVEDHVRQEKRAEAELHPGEDEQEHQRDARHDIGIQQRYVGQVH